VSHDPNHAPFRDDLKSAGCDLLPLTYRPNLKFQTTPIMKIREVVQNVQIEVVWGHSRSSAMSPFDTAHATSYSTLIETVHLSCTVFEIQPVICRKSPILTHATCIWRPCRGLHWANFSQIFSTIKLESLDYLVVLFV